MFLPNCSFLNVTMDDINRLINDIEQISVSDSAICSPEAVDNFISNTNNSLNVLHVNIRSINCNFDSLQILIHRLSVRIDVIILSECWLSKCPYIPELPGFASHQSGFKNQNDGVVAYIRKDKIYTIIEPVFNDANCLIIQFWNKLAVVALYRSPSYKNLNPFFNSLDLILTSLKSFNSLVMIGDLNINIIPSMTDSSVEEYLNLVASHALLPAHNYPTREENCLDHVIARTPFNAKTLVLDTVITDHNPVLFSCNLHMERSVSSHTSKNLDIAAIVKDLTNFDYSSILYSKNPNIASEIFVHIISDIISKHTRLVKISSKKRLLKPWISPGLLRCIRNRDKLYKKYKKNPGNLTHKLIYTRYRTFCNNLLKKVKREYHQTEFQKVRGNPKKAWSMINKIANINKKPSSANNLLKIHDDPSLSVDSVNTYFASIGEILASKIPSPIKLNTSNYTSNPAQFTGKPCPPSNSMVLYTVEYDEILHVIHSLKDNCALGWDGISTSIIKATRKVLTPILCHIFNLSFTTGVFPQIFKKALVHPIFKSGDRDSVSNYRPISVLTVMSKVFEKIINKRLVQFLNQNKILSENQFGFRSGRSTDEAVLKLSETVIENFDNKLRTIGIFLDLSKAFDTVSIPILLSKLECAGIRGVVQDLFCSYLSHRTQQVVIDGIHSREEPLSYGVPQGSVLGPTLFLIYVNDLCNLSIPNCKLITYADDTVLLVHGHSWAEVRELSENALRIVMNWLCCNYLTLNLSKTNFIAFAPNVTGQPTASFELHAHLCDNSTSSTICNCISLDRSYSIKYLGVMIDSAISWKHHITYMVSRVRKLIYVFKNLRDIVDFQYLKTVYYALAQSVISYCITSWGGTGISNMLLLERAQRAVLKVLSKKHFRFPTTELYVLCQVLTVRQLYILHTVLKKHTQLPFDPTLMYTKRRYDLVCITTKKRTAVARRHYQCISSMLYNRLNKELNIYPLTTYKCKTKCIKWLQSLSYQDTENLLIVLK